jgi:putative Ca2+/H+ antiporter (TMEM165/GDT1 family)
MHLDILLLVFGVIFIAELPDKSLFASLILSTKYHAGYVWLGAATAFLVHVIIAVTAGSILTLLPHHILELIVGCLFLAGAALVLFGKHGIEDGAPTGHELSEKEAHSFRKVFGTSFAIVFIGEWGDITQIAIANYVAKYHDTVNVAIGGTLGLWSVTALAIIAGSRVFNLVSPRVLQRVTGLVLLGFGIFSLISAVR